MKKAISKILIIGIVLRVLLSFTTYHSDVVPFDFAGRVLTETKITNFYDYLWEIPDDHKYLKVYPRDLFNYPPLPYFFLGGASLLTTWMVDSGVHDSFLFDLPSTLGNIQLNFLLLLLKLPYFVFDIAVAFLLTRFFKDKKKKLLAFGIWIFNPINLYATYMMGQFDIIPTFLVITALVLASNAPFWSAVLLGLGAGFKIFPLLFFIPLALLKKDWWGRLRLVLTAIVTYLITSYPFIFSEGFRKTAMLASQTTKSFYAQIPISGGESIILFLVAVLFFYFVFLYRQAKTESLWKRFFVMLLIFFIFTHYHPQWLLWITPFLIIDLVKTKFKHWPLHVLILVSYTALISFFDPGLSVWLFAPINKNLYGLSGIWELLGLNPDINILRSVFQTVYVGVAVYFLFYYFPKESPREK